MTAVERVKRENDPSVDYTLPISTRYVHILLDRSGSMASIKDAMEESFKGFLAEQQAIPGAGAIKFVLAQFDSQGVEYVIDGTLASARPFSLLPRGGTPLYDSITETIEKAEKRVGSDDTMLFIIITDGRDTGNDTATLESVRTLIAKKMDEGWVFSYLGANQDSWAVAASMGLSAKTTRNYAPNFVGVSDASAAYSGLTTAYRSSTRAELKNLTIDQTEPFKKGPK